MSGCMLHVVGGSLDSANESLGSLAPYATSRPRKGGVRYLVSDRDGKDLCGQVDDAIAFLITHRESIARLLLRADVDEAYLDFGYEVQLGDHVAVQVDFLPPRLLKLAGDLGLGIMLSLYPPLDP